MQATWRWGLTLIRSVQSVRHPALDGLAIAITTIGNAQTYLMLLVPFVVWCVDLAAGAWLGHAVIAAGYVNIWLKALFAHPRPFDLDPRVRVAAASGYGFPSGHAQLAVVGWGFVALHIGRPWAWALGGGLPLVIGLSRVYLGVHFPTDVLAGWLVGGAVLLLVAVGRRRIARWVEAAGPRWQAVLAAAVPAGIVLARPRGDVVALSGILAGLDLGLVAAARLQLSRPARTWWRRGLRLLLGAVGIASLFLVFSAHYSGDRAATGLVRAFLMTACFGLWVSLGAPWIFSRVRWLRDTP